MLNLSQTITILLVMGLLIFAGNQGHQNIDANLPITAMSSSEELTFAELIVESDSIAAGTFAPYGPPVNSPVRVEAGKDCIVDLVQTYLVTGTLSGSFEIDYRILVHGPCGAPPGTYAEEWIAHGSFDGEINGTPVSGKFSYVAKSKVDGEIEGLMVFDQGINGELEIKGNFNDRKLSYEGRLD